MSKTKNQKFSERKEVCKTKSKTSFLVFLQAATTKILLYTIEKKCTKKSKNLQKITYVKKENFLISSSAPPPHPLLLLRLSPPHQTYYTSLLQPFHEKLWNFWRDFCVFLLYYYYYTQFKREESLLMKNQHFKKDVREKKSWPANKQRHKENYKN